MDMRIITMGMRKRDIRMRGEGMVDTRHRTRIIPRNNSLHSKIIMGLGEEGECLRGVVVGEGRRQCRDRLLLTE